MESISNSNSNSNPPPKTSPPETAWQVESDPKPRAHREDQSPPRPGELEAAQRRILAHRYGLDEWTGQDTRSNDLSELASIARAIWKETVLIVGVLEEQVVVLGQALKGDDETTDWENAARKLAPVNGLLRPNGLPAGEAWDGKPKLVIVPDDSAELQALLQDENNPIGFFAFVPIQLPLPSNDSDILPMGGLLVCSREHRLPGSFTDEDKKLLLSIANLVSKELQRGHADIRRRKRTSQASFINRFLEATLSNSNKIATSAPSSRRESDSSHVAPDALRTSLQSPGMAAVTGMHFGPGGIASRHGSVFRAAAREISSVASGLGAVIFDLRAFSSSVASAETRSGDQQHRRLQHIDVLASHAFDSTMEDKIAGQEELQAISGAINGWRKNVEPYHANALSFLLPATSKWSLTIPIMDHTGVPVLLVLVSSDEEKQLDESDKMFIRNVGQICLSSLLREEAMSADRSKLAFVTQISHELRTPVHLLGGQLELTRQELVTSQQEGLRNFFKIADICLDSLKSIIDDSIDFAKLSNDADHGRVTPGVANDIVDLRKVIADATRAAWTRKMRMSSKSAEEEDDADARPLQVVDVILSFAGREKGWLAQVNLADLRRILSNILGNAFTFTSLGFVRLQLDMAPERASDGLSMVQISISDSGYGMTPEFVQDGLFEPFVQSNSFSPGAGLGMAIVRDLVTRMGGTIQVDSVLGEGTTIQLLLPIELFDSDPAVESVQVLSSELGSLKQIYKQRDTSRRGLLNRQDSMYTSSLAAPGMHLLKTDAHSRPGSVGPGDIRPALTSQSSMQMVQPRENGQIMQEAFAENPNLLKILCAEDNLIAQRVLTTFLRKLGHQIIAKDDGEEAVECFKEASFRPDVSVLDIGMPKKDGHAAAVEMREHEISMGWPRHTIIALTALSSAEDQAHGVQKDGKGGPFDKWLVKGGKALRQLEDELLNIQQSRTHTPSSCNSAH
ncbi:hypothetical protein T439DRAFT_381348 [Meredithblackwellia eburnea MCA 4105]